MAIRVAFADDNLLVREGLMHVLESLPEIDVVASAADRDGLMRAIDELTPDVVLTDYSMPDEDGLDLIREFRKAPSTRAVAVPILVLTAHTEDHWRARALAAGADDLLIKPFDPTVLVARIAAAVAPGRERTRVGAEAMIGPVRRIG